MSQEPSPATDGELLKIASDIAGGWCPCDEYNAPDDVQRVAHAYLAMRSALSEIAEFELAKKVIAWANNSLFGSHGYFLSDCGGPPEEHHLDMPIERLKADCNRWYNAAAPYSTPEALKEALSAPSATPLKPCPFCQKPDPNFKYDPQGDWT